LIGLNVVLLYSLLFMVRPLEANPAGTEAGPAIREAAVQHNGLRRAGPRTRPDRHESSIAQFHRLTTDRLRRPHVLHHWEWLRASEPRRSGAKPYCTYCERLAITPLAW